MVIHRDVVLTVGVVHTGLMYVLLYTPGRGLAGWDWFWVVIAALLDIGHWAAGATQRNQIPGRRPSAA